MKIDIRFSVMAVLLSVAVFLTAFAASGGPVVNGLFYGDGDESSYVLYNTSIGGSRLWYTVVSNRLYVALVVDRSVNDNVFGDRSYTRDAGWSPPHTARRLVDSEYARFTLTVGSTVYEWDQGYGEEVNGTWVSDHTTGAGSGTPPPDYVSSSSFAWNINNYMANPSPKWNLYANGTSINDWKSPFDPADPDQVIGLDGYPASGPIGYSSYYQWEWPMVYEWSVDLSGFGADPIFVISGQSHHSPAKNDSENDPFPDPPGNGFLSDYGDLPASYSTLLADGGPYHYIVPNGVSLGAGPDPEPDGNPDPDAAGDNALGFNDEDGVVLRSVQNGISITLDLEISGAGYLSAFMDLTASGSLSTVALISSTGPAALATGPVEDLYVPQGGVYTLTIEAPALATEIAARFRVTNNAGEGGASPTGPAGSGEVEDYFWDNLGSLSSAVGITPYVLSDGTVMLEISTVNEDGNGDITVYALFGDKWVEVARVPSEEVVGFGSNLYRTPAVGLNAGDNYRFRIVDESGKVFFTKPVLLQSLKPFHRVKKLKADGNKIYLTFDLEPFAWYAVMVSDSLGPSAVWTPERVQIVHPAFPGGLSSITEEIQGAPEGTTTVRIPRNRDKAFFKIIKIE